MWSVEEVIPRRTLAAIRSWCRRLKRCLRLASLGKHALARRARPADLWLPHASNCVQRTAAFDWDFRPLERGEPAVPFRPSGGDGPPPAGEVRRERLEALAHGFADAAIVSEIVQGVRDDAQCVRGTLLCAPHGGALRLFEQADEKLQKNVTKGWATCSSSLPCYPIRASPYSVVDESVRAGEPKFRLTNDLSWPHAECMSDDSGGFVESVNGSMKREWWPENHLPRAALTAEAAAILQTSGAPVELWGLDCDAYYRRFGRQRSELWRNAIATIRGFQLDERCCFGSAADATKCSRASNLIRWLIAKRCRAIDQLYPPRDPKVVRWLNERREMSGSDTSWTDLFFVSVYIDDVSGASLADDVCDVGGAPLLRDGTPVRRSRLHYEAAIELLTEIGHLSAVRKEQPPSLKLETLGLEIDLELNCMRVTSGKCSSYAKKIRGLLATSACDRADLVSVLSRLLFAASCYPAGRPWLNAAWRVARAQFALDADRVALNVPAREGLARWAALLDHGMSDGVPLASKRFPTFDGEECGAIYADASGLQGWCAWTVAHGELLICYGPWARDELKDESFIIAEKELLASTLGLVTLAPLTKMRFVYEFTDNTNAEGAMRRLRTKSRRVESLLERRGDWLQRNSIFSTAERITSKSNLWADMGSRGEGAEVERAAASMGLAIRRVDPPSEWRSTVAWRRVNAKGGKCVEDPGGARDGSQM